MATFEVTGGVNFEEGSLLLRRDVRERVRAVDAEQAARLALARVCGTMSAAAMNPRWHPRPRVRMLGKVRPEG